MPFCRAACWSRTVLPMTRSNSTASSRLSWRCSSCRSMQRSAEDAAGMARERFMRGFPPSPAHSFIIGVEERRRLHARGVALAEQFDLEAVALLGDFLRHVAHGDRCLRIVCIAARRYPAAHFAAEPDRLVADHVRVDGVHDEGAQPELSALLAFF